MAMGLGITMWSAPLIFSGTLQDLNAAGVSDCLIFPLAADAPGQVGTTDREYHITDITLHNPGTTTARARLAKTAGGVVTTFGQTPSPTIVIVSLEPGQTWVWSGKIPLASGWGLIGMADKGLGDECIFAAIAGEATN